MTTKFPRAGRAPLRGTEPQRGVELQRNAGPLLGVELQRMLGANRSAVRATGRLLIEAPPGAADAGNGSCQRDGTTRRNT